MHYLDLEIKDTADEATMAIGDLSKFDAMLPVTDLILEIKGPGAKCYIPFHLTDGYCTKILDCDDLQVCVRGCGTARDPLADGVYEIKYSVAPNLKTMREFYHLRATSLMKRYISMLCTFLQNKCSHNKRDYDYHLSRFVKIHETINHAKWMVSETGDVDAGLDLYEQAQKLLNDVYTGCGCS